MNIREYIKKNILILDGGMGTLLQAQGLKPGERPEIWNLTRPDIITGIHRSYYEAGSNVVNTNTFGANGINFSTEELRRIIPAAVENARKAGELSAGDQPKYVALDIGPSGRLLKPFGDLDFEDAVSLFADIVRIGVPCGVDLIVIETMNDSYETKAALLAAKENSDLPVFVTNAYGSDGKLLTGADAAAMTAMLEGMGADAVGVNCSLGPDQLSGVVRQYLRYASVPVIMKPNAGMPRDCGGRTVYDVGPEDFTASVSEMVREGVRIAGGCCGTTPEYIRQLAAAVRDIRPAEITEKPDTIISSYSHAVFFSEDPILIGERINPTGKKRFRQALAERDMDYIIAEGLKQEEAGVHVLDVNVGAPGIDEPGMLEDVVRELQGVTGLPLQIDTSNPEAMERALRRYNGKALVNSLNGKKESMDAIFPLIRKYGGVAVCLTLDENGIPAAAEDRIRIAEKIIDEAEKYGISRKNLVFDTLTMTVSADSGSAQTTLNALRTIREKFGVHTVLGVSNVSFGLPERGMINGVFFAMALQSGLSAAIMNPFSKEMMRTYHSYRALRGLDNNFASYIAFAETQKTDSTPAVPVRKPADDTAETLDEAIGKGRKELAERLTSELLKTKEPLEIINGEVIPALDRVGKNYETRKIYLPQLLMSAEAAKAAFECIKTKVSSGVSGNVKCPFVIATVKGDIHDIGKNIVKLLLENYGFRVYDLGKDVDPQRILDKVTEVHSPLCGLSALMTTTVPAMEETIRLIREKAPWCRVIVGGAVLTRDYAARIGADRYGRDAMDTVRYAEEVFESLK